MAHKHSCDLPDSDQVCLARRNMVTLGVFHPFILTTLFIHSFPASRRELELELMS